MGQSSCLWGLLQTLVVLHCGLCVRLVGSAVVDCWLHLAWELLAVNCFIGLTCKVSQHLHALTRLSATLLPVTHCEPIPAVPCLLSLSLLLCCALPPLLCPPRRLLELTGAKEPAALEKLVKAVGVKPASVNKDLLMYKGVLSKLSAAKVRVAADAAGDWPQPEVCGYRCLAGTRGRY